MTRNRIIKNVDWLTILIYLILILFGWLNIYSADFNPEHPTIFDIDREYGKQFIWICITWVLAFIIFKFERNLFITFSYQFYGFVVLLLLGVLLIGAEINGAKAWFKISGFALQPSELSKVAISLALAKYLSMPGIKMDDFSVRLNAFIIITVPAALIFLQPDVGTLLVYSAFVLVLYREGLSGNILLIAILAGVLTILSLIMKPTSVSLFVESWEISGQVFLVAIIVLIGVISFFGVRQIVLPRYRKPIYQLIIFGVIGSCALIGSTEYVFEKLPQHQKNRINILLGLYEDPQGAEFNVIRSKIAIGSGKFLGKGYHQGRMTRYKHVPKQSTDFIFCTVGEEWGFIGTFTLIVLFVFFLIRIVIIAERQRSIFTRVYSYCAACIFFLHFTINIGMAIDLAPVVGIPLPFFSYGGSSLLDFSLLLFILLRLDAERKDVLG